MAMEKRRIIWNHEIAQADDIARRLIDRKRTPVLLQILLFPISLISYLRLKRTILITRKNLLFTRKLALAAAAEIDRGKPRASEIAAIDLKTREILGRDQKGLYTEKVRRKQLHEIEVLISHYCRLFSSRGGSYNDLIAEAYRSRDKYLSFLSKLRKSEMEVIQAAITSTRRGSKQDRVQWFQKVKEVTEQARLEGTESLFPDA